MAHQHKTRLLNYLGFVAWGDIGNLTIYRRYDRRLVIFGKTWPVKPATPKQATERARFAAAAVAWRALTPAQRQQWTLAAQRASLPLTGYNLWQFWQATANAPPIRALQRQTNTDLIP